MPDTLSCGHEACTTPVHLPGLKPEIETLDFRPTVGGLGKPVPDEGEETNVDISAFHPRGRRSRDLEGVELVVDEPRSILRPKDDCEPTES